MSFTAHDIQRWLADEPGSRLCRADGLAWSQPDDVLARIVLDGATLDSRRVGVGTLFVGVPGERTHGGRFLGSALDAGADVALVEAPLQPVDGAAQPVFVVDDGRAALARLAERYLSRFAPTVVGITGSNGKTTTKDLLRSALRGSRTVGANPGNLNSRWGLPLAVLSQSGAESVLVLEMGASEPGEIAALAKLAHPRVGCITNIAPAHLEWFGDEDGVARAKGALLEALPDDGLAVLNRDDKYYDALRARAGSARQASFGRDRRADFHLARCQQRADGLDLEVNGREQQLPVFGEANGLNAAAACAAAAEFGVDVATALSRMAETSLSPHRSRLLQRAGRTILDDCYNANPGSVTAALQSLASLEVSGRRMAVLGDMAELGGGSEALHRAVMETARELRLDAVISVGPQMKAAYDAVWPSDPTTATRADFAPRGSDEELDAWLSRVTAAGDALLFKASRSAELERVLQGFLGRLGED